VVVVEDMTDNSRERERKKNPERLNDEDVMKFIAAEMMKELMR